MKYGEDLQEGLLKMCQDKLSVLESKTSYPLVTIAIPCYNHELYVEECIRSVLAQDYENIELIIIDDGSKDSSVEVVKKFVDLCKQRFVRFEFRSRENRGVCKTLNEALEWSKGDFFSPSASDDILLPHKISAQVRSILEGGEGVVGALGGISIFDTSGDVVKTERGLGKKVFFDQILLRNIPLPGQATMLNRKDLLRVKGYDENFKVEDLFVFLKMTEEGNSLISMNEVVILYRRHGGNLSSNHELMWDAISSILKMYSRNELYSRALSHSMIIQAHSLHSDFPIQAMKWMIKSFANDLRVVKYRGIWTLILKFLLPNSFIKWLKRRN